MRQQNLRLAAIVVCAVLLLGNEVIMAQEDYKPQPSECSAQQSPTPVEQEAPAGFTETQEEDARSVGTPVDPEQDLDASFPQPDAVFNWPLPPEWFQFKKDLYEKYGLKVGVSYQMLYQEASDSLTDEDTAFGQFGLFEGKWELLNRDQDFMGSQVWSFDWRSTIGGRAQAFNFHLDTGSLWPTDFVHLDWGPGSHNFSGSSGLKKTFLSCGWETSSRRRRTTISGSRTAGPRLPPLRTRYRFPPFRPDRPGWRPISSGGRSRTQNFTLSEPSTT